MSDNESDFSESKAKRGVQKLQKTIVNALEDIKAVDIRVFNTEAMSPLFERVIIASGNSNRQTKALAASVRDELRKEGFPKPRSEGEENGEWIIVDCGAAVVHIMQPAIRQYYHLEDIWGEKPVRLKGPASSAKPPASAKSASTPSVTPKRSAPSKPRSAKPSSGSVAAKKAKPFAKSAARPAAKSSRVASKSKSATASKAAPRKSGPKS